MGGYVGGYRVGSVYTDTPDMCIYESIHTLWMYPGMNPGMANIARLDIPGYG